MPMIRFDNFNGGVHYGVPNNALKENESPTASNYIVSDSGLESCKGYAAYNDTQLVASTGLDQFQEIYDGTSYRVLAKCGTRLFDVATTGISTFLVPTITEAGDAGNQLTSWVFAGAGNSNTNAGVLYWSLTNSTTTRTVSIYKNSDGAAGNLVAQGSRSGDGSITLTAQNSSGLSGSVSVTYASDDTTLSANTLTFWTMAAADDVNFESWQSRYFFMDGTNIYSGTTGTAAAVSQLDQDGNPITGSAVTGDYLLQHYERLWALDKSAGAVYFSETGYYNRFHVDAGSNVDSKIDAFDYGDGQSLTAFVRYNDKIMVFKQHKCFFIEGDDAEDNLRWPFAGPFGALNQKAVALCVDGFVRGVDTEGAWEYSDMTGFRRISRKIDSELKLIAATNWDLVSVGSWDKYFLVSYAIGDSVTANCKVMIADVQRRDELGHPCWMPRDEWCISSFALFKSTELLYSGRSNAGYIDRLFYGDTDNGATIKCSWTTPKITPVPGVRCQLDAIRGVLGYGVQLVITCYNELKKPFTFTKTYTSIGTPWADENNPDSGGFVWGDEGTPSSGSSFVSEDSNDDSNRFQGLVPNGKLLFNDIQVVISKIDATKQQVEYVEIYYTPLRKVI